MNIVLSPEVISVLRPISTVMIGLAVSFFLFGRLVLRPKRFKEEVLTQATEEEDAKVLRWKEHAGHTLEQTLYNFAGILTVIGGVIFLILKRMS